jgi:membrane protease YdiL (CAAX protease family)
VAFFVLVYLVSVPWWLLEFFVEVDGLPKNLRVTELILAFSPVIAASILVAREEGFFGVRRLWARLFDVRRITSMRWLVPTLLLLPLISVVSYAGASLLGVALGDLPEISLQALPLLALAFFIGAAGEELGYMGYVADPMQERHGALVAGIVIGTLWGLWHFPALLQGGHSLLYALAGLPAAIGVRILAFWIYNNTGRSVFAVNVFHVTALLSSSVVPTAAASPATVLAVVAVVALWGPTLVRSGSRERQSRIPRQALG